MESVEIKELLDKYWDGNTTIEEEEHLKKYFSEEETPDHLEGVATLFRTFNADRKFKTLDDSFDEKLFQAIENSKRKKPNKYWLQVAASVLLLIGATFVTKSLLPNDVSKNSAQVEVVEDTYQDPQLAFEQTKEALLLISAMMERGATQVEKLEKFHEAQVIIKPER